MTTNKTSGFSAVLIIILIVVVLGAALVWMFFLQQQQLPSGTFSQRDSQTVDCGSFSFTHDPIAFDQIEEITPPGSIIAGSLKAHSYITFTPDQVALVAPTDMTLVAGAKYTEPSAPDKIQYLLDFEADCGYSIRYDHISDPNEEIASLFPTEPSSTTHTQSLESIEYQAGSIIGFTDGNGVQHQFDFGVYKEGVTNQFAEDARYQLFLEGDMQTSAVCPFDLYPADKTKQYYALFRVTSAHPQPDILCSEYEFKE